MRIVWLRGALRNLIEEAEYVARADRRAAVVIVARIRASVERLTVHPQSGRAGRVPGTRELVVPGTPYIVPYRVVGDTVQVLRVFHAKRRWPLQL